MTNLGKNIPWFLTFPLVMAIAGWATAVPPKGDEKTPVVQGGPNRVLVFIVNKVSPIDNLSIQEIRRVFLGERTKWPDGHKVTVVMEDQGMEGREAFLRLVCHMSESDYNRYVLQSAFTGAVQGGPRTLSSASGVVKFVSLVPGAIGYVCLGEADDSVKVIKIDGTSPNAPGYKFEIKKGEGPHH